ncbi:Homoserine/homoserine lactone efflux protein [Ralstonia mannitolilytica]|uniref:Homoserine/homoserine lactone efflux protein n=1 Tax=Ralstonia mannitolilytica TaxID=105219 RepID=A0AAD2ELE3_9RALS|nr:Homoserine/homoserine lactone efflux protein [Ralstonia mannitolilytica]CAJ0882706.1 Homoserine/homoserine lactone efflux protein [Ralstonia mannitolilytica]CAJ0883472.1 Homoserine/homoserine lactone efflux protein [Ralstonia mannitolilytica]
MAGADPPGPIRLGRSADGDVDAVPLSSARRRFFTGLLTNVTNPKGIVFMAAVLPQFIDPARPLLPQLCILAATMVCIDLVVLHGYALLAERAQRVFHNPRALRWQRRVFGGTLMSLGAALFFMKRQTS